MDKPFSPLLTGEAKLFAVAAPGIESITAAELRLLGSQADRSSQNSWATNHHDDYDGGVPFQGDFSALYRANLHLRTASRILVRVGEFRAVAFYELRKKAARLPWESFLTPGQSVNLRVTCRKSRLYHSAAVAERVEGAIADRLGYPVTIRAPQVDELEEDTQLIVVRLLHDICTISIDSSGSGLHRRGYRQAVAKAPLRETLAAAMLLAAGWDRSATLVDPFCGSGTIAIEAALLASGTPPGLQRSFAFMSWPGYHTEDWEQLCGQIRIQTPPRHPSILAFDRDAGAIQMALENAIRAGVDQWIDFKRQAFSDLPALEGGWLITNPPYGVRVSHRQDLRNLYQRLGQVVRHSCRDCHYAILSNDDRLLSHLHLPESQRLRFVNGGIPVKLLLGQTAEPVSGG